MTTDRNTFEWNMHVEKGKGSMNFDFIQYWQNDTSN